MWSGPRNLSTAMMRSWENRPDTVVIDEPFYPYHLASTGMEHPMREETIAAGPTNLDDAVARCLAPLGEGMAISYQKHMSAHLTPELPRGWLDSLTHGLLLRHPYRVIASYSKEWEVFPLDQTGLPQQLELLDRAVVVLDSDDFLTAPDRYLPALCAALGVGFDPAMLSWPPGGRDTDGVWGAVWYSSVQTSTKFGPPPGPVPALSDLPTHLQPMAVEALEIYEHLRTGRLVL